jgi:pyrroloquinoline quinone biosynthesis protein B
MKFTYFLLFCLLLSSCNTADSEKIEAPIPETKKLVDDKDRVSLIILGTVQDAGSPQIACAKSCCKDLFSNPDPTRKVVSIGVADYKSQRKFLFEATPDMVSQVKRLSRFAFDNGEEIPYGTFLTHAHIGHYTGLMYYGKEAMNADKTRVFALPKMRSFLRENGPWSQLVDSNISLQSIEDGRWNPIAENFRVMAFTVPHRDEFSETAGYVFYGKKKSVLFIPDIDKWSKWDKDIIKEIAKVDYAFIDATFYDAEEINNRDISEIPHPFIIESMELFKDLPKSEKRKIYFIHMNHTNPALNVDSPQSKKIIKNGFNIARYNDVFEL